MALAHVHDGSIMTTSFEPTWYWHCESLFWPEQIMRIREICERHERAEALTGDLVVPGEADHRIRKNMVSWHDNEELYSILRGPMHEVNKQSGWNYDITAIEPVQYTVYCNEGDHYHWHSDTLVLGEPERGEEHLLNNTVRKISCSIQLDKPEDYEGGEFELLTLGTEGSNDIEKDLKGDGYLKLQPLPLPHFRNKGSAMFFPSYTYHRVKPVTKGIRRSLVAWFRGKKWC
jgi:PKHD-type hydroxylase